MPIFTKEEVEARQLKEEILLQPARAEAIKLLLRAAQPEGLTVGDEGGSYFVNPEGLVSWGPAMEQATEVGEYSCKLESMPSINLLFWVHDAASALVDREMRLGTSSDPTGLGL